MPGTGCSFFVWAEFLPWAANLGGDTEVSTPGPFCTFSLSQVTPEHTSSGRGWDVLQEVNLGRQENKNRLVDVLEELLWLWKYPRAVPQPGLSLCSQCEGLKGWFGVWGCSWGTPALVQHLPLLKSPPGPCPCAPNGLRGSSRGGITPLERWRAGWGHRRTKKPFQKNGFNSSHPTLVALRTRKYPFSSRIHVTSPGPLPNSLHSR